MWLGLESAIAAAVAAGEELEPLARGDNVDPRLPACRPGEFGRRHLTDLVERQLEPPPSGHGYVASSLLDIL